ncbi:MAG: hypothetical protein AB8G23_08385 [Myxococcota bacterium]
MKKACIVAGVKLALGLIVLLCVMGARISMVGGSAEQGDVEANAQHASAATATSPERNAPQPAESAEAAASVFERARAAVAKRVEGSPGAAAADPNRMVSCATAQGSQFMSGADCAMRGGRAAEI